MEKSNCQSNQNTSCDAQVPQKTNSKQHWENVYSKNDWKTLGWYEENPKPSLDLIDLCNLKQDANILNVGAGTTTLIDSLINKGFNSIIATDISENALKIVTERIQNPTVLSSIVDDLTQPNQLKNLPKIDLWHDRAVLHFFTDTKDIKTYFDLLKSKIKLNGYVILATFNFDGATKCSGLPIKQYDTNSLTNALGSDFKLLKDFNFTYTMPSGDKREYVYTLFQKQN